MKSVFRMKLKKYVMFRYIYLYLMTITNKKSSDYFSFRRHAKNSDKVFFENTLSNEHDDVTIIIQGPVIDGYTEETVKLYRKFYPEVHIVVSTWVETSVKSIKKLQESGAEVVLSEKKITSGIGNINYQIQSTRAGIEAAKNNGKTYILKTRSDQRFYKFGTLDYLKSLLKTFPIKNKNDSSKERLIFLHHGVRSNMFIPFFLGDFFYFGDLKTIEKLFSIEMNQSINRTNKQELIWREKIKNETSIGEYYFRSAPELNLAYKYAKSVMDNDVSYTIKDYWVFLEKFAIIIGYEDIDLHWNKYDRTLDESAIQLNYHNNDNEKKKYGYSWNFTNWLNIYTGQYRYDKNFELFREMPANEFFK